MDIEALKAELIEHQIMEDCSLPDSVLSLDQAHNVSISTLPVDISSRLRTPLQKKEEYYLGIIRHCQPNAVQDRPKKAYQLKEEQLILIIANYQRGVYDSKADFLQAIAETNGAAFIDEMPEDNHYLVNEGINDSEYEDSEQPSSDSEDE